MTMHDGTPKKDAWWRKFHQIDTRHAWSIIVPHPLRLNIEDGLWIQGAILWTALGRGVDYLDTEATPAANASLGVIEQAAPLLMWGLFMIAAVAMVVAGMTSRYRNYVWLSIAGHAGLAITYLLLGLGQLIVVWDRPFLDGFRTGLGLLIAGTVIHWRMALALHRHYILGVRQ